MSYAALNLALETYIDANYSETAVQYESTSQLESLGSSQEWIAVNTIFGDAEPRTLGPGVTESMQNGRVMVRVFTPDKQGSLRARQIADAFITMISNKFIGDAYFWQAFIIDVGPREGYFQLNVIAPFYWRII